MVIPLFCQAVKPQPLYTQKNQVQEQYVNTDLCLDVAFDPIFSESEMSIRGFMKGWIQWPIQNRHWDLGVWAFYHKYQSLHDFWSHLYEVGHMYSICCEKISYFPFCPAATSAHRSSKRFTTLVLLQHSPVERVYLVHEEKRLYLQQSDVSNSSGRVREAKYLQGMLVAPSRWCRGGGMTLASWVFCVLPRAIRTSLPSPLMWPQAHSATVSVPRQSHLPLLSWSAPPCALEAVLVIMLLHGVCPAH